eukprot:GFKZ01003635.1.p1 GENE.GFKZ01003635.1~~GFKZ01003635.1.p1  ORF type:complete len:806 (+),score=56.02 GFKZ01003635.1:42-2459(+)
MLHLCFTSILSSTMVPPIGQGNGEPLEISFSFYDSVVMLFNFFYLAFKPRTLTNFRWANTLHDKFAFVGYFAPNQFAEIYGRVTARYKFHPQQRFRNSIRRFNLSAHLEQVMRQEKSVCPFYRAVCNRDSHIDPEVVAPDFTKLSDISSVTSSADYLHEELCARRNRAVADIARSCYVRGYSRSILVDSHEDWEKFRNEIRSRSHVHETKQPGSEKLDLHGVHLGAGEEVDDGQILLLAVSYKAKDVKISRRMRTIDAEGELLRDNQDFLQMDQQLTADFLEDFRWSQLVRSSSELARVHGKTKVRLWIDRLVMMGVSGAKRKSIYSSTKWEDFGLFAYAVCPVIRLYDKQEPHFNTDFWRKLETVMGVAGRGLVVDDYMLRKYDHTIFFDPEMYSRLNHGLSIIGGGGIYLRAVTLALATALLTDGISVSEANEDIRTKRAATKWKAWALHTIGQGAYSSHFSSMMSGMVEPYVVTILNFPVIAFWESMVTRCSHLVGTSYLDMSLQQSTKWRKDVRWDGVLEWVGMLQQSCKIHPVEKANILAFLDVRTTINTYVTTTGHSASLIYLHTEDGADKRTIAVNLSRFSLPSSGHVVSVAEATGLWNGPVLPCYLQFKVNPDKYQRARVDSNGELVYEHEQMEIEMVWDPVLTGLAIVTISLGTVITAVVKGISSEGGSGGGPAADALLPIIEIWAVSGLVLLVSTGILRSPSLSLILSVTELVLLFFIFLMQVTNLAVFAIIWILAWGLLGSVLILRYSGWPWMDRSDIGEELFDNLVLHGLFDSGIKRKYRELHQERYSRVAWT